MKLYATVTSERATKGQGGEKLEIVVMGQSREELAHIRVFPEIDEENLYCLRLEARGLKEPLFFSIKGKKTKGKNQKGEKCLSVVCKSVATKPCGYCNADCQHFH